MSTSTETYFAAYLRLATERARDWYESCQRACADRTRLGGPTLEEIYADWELLEAFGGGEFDPRGASRSPLDADVLADAINQEIVARGTFEECLAAELDRMFYNLTAGVRASLRERVPLCLN